MQAVPPGKLIKSVSNIFPIICGCSFGKEIQKFSGFYLKEELAKTELNLCFMKAYQFPPCYSDHHEFSKTGTHAFSWLPDVIVSVRFVHHVIDKGIHNFVQPQQLHWCCCCSMLDQSMFLLLMQTTELLPSWNAFSQDRLQGMPFVTHCLMTSQRLSPLVAFLTPGQCFYLR